MNRPPIRQNITTTFLISSRPFLVPKTGPYIQKNFTGVPYVPINLRVPHSHVSLSVCVYAADPTSACLKLKPIKPEPEMSPNADVLTEMRIRISSLFSTRLLQSGGWTLFLKISFSCTAPLYLFWEIKHLSARLAFRAPSFCERLMRVLISLCLYAGSPPPLPLPRPNRFSSLFLPSSMCWRNGKRGGLASCEVSRRKKGFDKISRPAATCRLLSESLHTRLKRSCLFLTAYGNVISLCV